MIPVFGRALHLSVDRRHRFRVHKLVLAESCRLQRLVETLDTGPCVAGCFYYFQHRRVLFTSSAYGRQHFFACSRLNAPSFSVWRRVSFCLLSGVPPSVILAIEKAFSWCPPTVDTLNCLPARGFRVPPRFLTIALGSFHTLHALHALHLFPSEFLQGPLSDCCAGRRFCHVCQRATLHLRLPILARSFISCRFVAGRYQFVCQRLILSSILPVSPVQSIIISSYATLPVHWRQ